MKNYIVYYTIKMNGESYLYAMKVEAKNANEAKDLCTGIVFRETGRNAFTPSTKLSKWDIGKEIYSGMPPVKIG